MIAYIIVPADKRLLTSVTWRPSICTGFQIYDLGECFVVALPRGGDIGRPAKRVGRSDHRNDQARSGFSRIGVSFPPQRRTRAPPTSHGRGWRGSFIPVAKDGRWRCFGYGRPGPTSKSRNGFRITPVRKSNRLPRSLPGAPTSMSFACSPPAGGSTAGIEARAIAPIATISC